MPRTLQPLLHPTMTYTEVCNPRTHLKVNILLHRPEKKNHKNIIKTACGVIGQSPFQLPTSRVHPCRSLLFVFTRIFILVSHREGTKIKVKNMVKIKWNTTLIFILVLHSEVARDIPDRAACRKSILRNKRRRPTISH